MTVLPYSALNAPEERLCKSGRNHETNLGRSRKENKNKTHVLWFTDFIFSLGHKELSSVPYYHSYSFTTLLCMSSNHNSYFEDNTANIISHLPSMAVTCVIPQCPDYVQSENSFRKLMNKIVLRYVHTHAFVYVWILDFTALRRDYGQ